MRRIDGKAIASTLRTQNEANAARLAAAGITAVLAVVIPTRDEASAWYARSLARAAGLVGVVCRVEELSEPSEVDINDRLDLLSTDPTVHGIICQTPLPEGMKLEQVSAHIVPSKDVDGANPTSLGRLAAGLPCFAPATAAAVLEILHHEQVPLCGARVVVVGRSNVIGKPAALLLTGQNATVTLCHSRTRDLAARCMEADVLVVAIGRPHTVGAAHVRSGAIVIDVGTNPTPDGSLIGDVDDEDLADKDGALTPVPGGVGPVTTQLLLRNTLSATIAARSASA